MTRHISTVSLLSAIAAGENCSVAQIVVRTGVSGFAVEAACQDAENRGLITGSGQPVRRRYALSKSGQLHLARRVAKPGQSTFQMTYQPTYQPTVDDLRRAFLLRSRKETQAVRAHVWSEIRRLRRFTRLALIATVEARYPASERVIEAYLYALLRAGIVSNGGDQREQNLRPKNHAPAIYQLLPEADPGPLPVLWKSVGDTFFDGNSGRTFSLFDAATPLSSRASPRRLGGPIDSPPPHDPGA